VAAVAVSRVLGQNLFGVEIVGALAHGKVAEMQTGDGKTLAAVPAIAWFARDHHGVHVMTVNHYLARRDTAWMETSIGRTLPPTKRLATGRKELSAGFGATREVNDRVRMSACNADRSWE
jgi:Rad3-related DNA helicase